MKKINLVLLIFTLICSIMLADVTYPIVDTDQILYYNNSDEISAPVAGEEFYGQDANFSGNQPNYTDNGDGTITDNVTGLMWSKTCDTDGDCDIYYDDNLSYEEAVASAQSVNIAD